MLGKQSTTVHTLPHSFFVVIVLSQGLTRLPLDFSPSALASQVAGFMGPYHKACLHSYVKTGVHKSNLGSQVSFGSKATPSH